MFYMTESYQNGRGDREDGQQGSIAYLLREKDESERLLLWPNLQFYVESHRHL